MPPFSLPRVFVRVHEVEAASLVCARGFDVSIDRQSNLQLNFRIVEERLCITLLQSMFQSVGCCGKIALGGVSEADKGLEGGVSSFVDNVRVGVVDPLKADIMVGREVTKSVCLHLGSREVVDALDVHLLQLRLLCDSIRCATCSGRSSSVILRSRVSERGGLRRFVEAHNGNALSVEGFNVVGGGEVNVHIDVHVGVHGLEAGGRLDVADVHGAECAVRIQQAEGRGLSLRGERSDAVWVGRGAARALGTGLRTDGSGGAR